METLYMNMLADWVHGDITSEAEITSVCTDTRAIQPGCLFIPLVGERFDGHDYIEKAIAGGAAAVMSARRGERYDCPTLYVNDTRQALLDLAQGYREQYAFPVVGVTGSVGKTTTKEMIAAVLGREFQTVATKGNLNNQIGLPLTILRMDDTTEAAVLELGMNHPGEISSMVKAAQPDVAVITNIGTCHIEYLGSREGICQAKLELCEGLAARGGIAILPADEPLLWEKRDSFPFRVMWFGIDNPEAFVHAENIVCGETSVTFDLCWKKARYPAVLPLPGRHNVQNALAAAAVGTVVGVDTEDIIEALANIQITGRQELYEKNGFWIYDDCYNASPDSMEAALSVLAGQHIAGRRIAVLGGMAELGDYSEMGHRRAGKAAAASADALYLYGAGTEWLAEEALKQGMEQAAVHCFDSREALADALKATAQTGDLLLFKGSHCMKLEQVLRLFLCEEETV